MGLISIEGMHFHALHGFYEEEQVLGNEFVVDIFIETNFAAAAVNDELGGTINYETIFLICKTEMGKPVKLLETLGANILQALKHQFQRIKSVRVKVRKLNPIPGGQVTSAGIEIESDFSSNCARCKRPILCYGDGTCWCQDVKVPGHTLASLRKKYEGCLCKSCLTEYS